MAQVVPYIDAAVDAAEFINSNADPTYWRSKNSFRFRPPDSYQRSASKRKFIGGVQNTSKRIKPSGKSQTTSLMRVRRSRRRRFKRRTHKRRFKRNLGSIRTRPSRIQRRVLSFVETNRIHVFDTAFSLPPSDGTGYQTFVLAPFAYGYSQGTSSNQFIGNNIFLVGFKIKLFVSGANVANTFTANNVWVHATHIWSKYQSDVTAAGSIYSSATTPVVAPAQVDPNTNIPLYDDTNPFAPHLNQFYFDNSKLKVIKAKKFKLSTFGQAGTKAFLEKNLWYPIGRKWTINDTAEVVPTAPFFGRYGNHYWLLRTMTGDTTVTNATEPVTVNMSVTLYWKNVQ